MEVGEPARVVVAEPLDEPVPAEREPQPEEASEVLVPAHA